MIRISIPLWSYFNVKCRKNKNNLWCLWISIPLWSYFNQLRKILCIIRLYKFPSHYGLILTFLIFMILRILIISIPLWSYFNSPVMRGDFMLSLFPSHYGLILTWEIDSPILLYKMGYEFMGYIRHSDKNFHPTMVLF